MQSSKANLIFSFEEYSNGKLFDIHKEISYYYNNQNTNDFQQAINELEPYLRGFPEVGNPSRFLQSLEVFKNVEDNYREIIKLYVNQFYNFIKVIFENNLSKCYYFIGSLLKALKISKNDVKGQLQLFHRSKKISYEDLFFFKGNINKIICFKDFLQAIPSAKQGSGFFSSRPVLITINYKYMDDYQIDFFDISRTSFSGEKLFVFGIFSFFKIIDVKINRENKNGEIILDFIGKQKNFESTISRVNNNNIRYIESKNIIEIM